MLNWNGGGMTLDALASLSEAGASEMIVVDNGSKDGSLQEIEKRFPKVRVLRNETNQGFAKAANWAIANATPENDVWLVNSDCLVAKDTLTLMQQELRSDSQIGVVGVVLVEFEERSEVQAWGGGSLDLVTGIGRHLQSSAERLDYVVGACALIRRALLLEIGGFDERYFFYWEDVDFSFRARAAGWSLAVADKAVVPHVEAGSLGRWSAKRAEQLFVGLYPFMKTWSRSPRLATMLRLVHHSLTALRRGRWSWLAGAWRGVGKGVAVAAKKPEIGGWSRVGEQL